MSPLPRFRSLVALAWVLGGAPAPVRAAQPARATLVHCGSGTCLQVSGTRASAGTPVLIGGRAMPVEGGRHWRVAMPLAEARGLTIAPGGTVTVTLLDADSGGGRSERVALPPGSLAGHVELATLVVAAH